MNKEEKQLKSTRDQLLAELKECNDKLDAIKAQKYKQAETKRTYQMNYVEPKYEVDWKGYATTLETAIDKLAQGLPNYKEIQEQLTGMKNANSFKIPVDPSKLWNCPKCGKVMYYILEITGLTNLIENMQLHALNAISLDLRFPIMAKLGVNLKIG